MILDLLGDNIEAADITAIGDFNEELPSEITIIGHGGNRRIIMANKKQQKGEKWTHNSLQPEEQIGQLVNMRYRYVFIVQKGVQTRVLLILGKDSLGRIRYLNLLGTLSQTLYMEESVARLLIEDGKIKIIGMVQISIKRRNP